MTTVQLYVFMGCRSKHLGLLLSDYECTALCSRKLYFV